MSGRSVTVRMYRGILGDCFLLRIEPGPNEDPALRSHVLIDCGVLQGVAGGATRMKQIAQDIREVTGGKLDCVIVTHEHFDHISGFKYAADLFAGMEIRCLWLAWTEDPRDPKGIELQERFAAAHQKLAALQVARINLGLDTPLDDAADEDSERVLGLAGFNAPMSISELAVLAADGGKRGSKRILADLCDWANAGPARHDHRDKVEYLRPGDILETPAEPGAPKLRTYVLGPPYEDKHLFKALPSKGAAKETYLLGLDAEEGGDKAAAHSPFAPPYRWYTAPAESNEGDPAPAAKKDQPEPPPQPVPEFIARRYFADVARCRFAHDGADGDPTREPGHHSCDVDFVCGHRQDYRRIDDLLDVEQSALALKMDNNTNNTSLVLAFELGYEKHKGPTLLFAADAQVGNWQSWEQVEFRAKGADKTTTPKEDVTTEQLLSRAKLYKVGHHGSHNATLKAKGLELMIDPDLVAMIPTVEDIALQQGKKGWQMPNPETYKGLIRQTKGRVLRGDLFWNARSAQLTGLREQIKELIAAENTRITEQRLNETLITFDEGFEPLGEEELYVDLCITC